MVMEEIWLSHTVVRLMRRRKIIVQRQHLKVETSRLFNAHFLIITTCT